MIAYNGGCATFREIIKREFVRRELARGELAREELVRKELVREIAKEIAKENLFLIHCKKLNKWIHIMLH